MLAVLGSSYAECTYMFYTTRLVIYIEFIFLTIIYSYIIYMYMHKIKIYYIWVSFYQAL